MKIITNAQQLLALRNQTGAIVHAGDMTIKCDVDHGNGQQLRRIEVTGNLYVEGNFFLPGSLSVGGCLGITGSWYVGGRLTAGGYRNSRMLKQVANRNTAAVAA